MPSTPRPPYQLRRPGWIVPGLSLLMLFGLTISAHALLDPATRRLAFDTSDLSAEVMDPIKVARIGASARAWALSYLATIVGSVYTIGLLLLYLVPAAAIAGALQRSAKEARREAWAPASLQTWTVVLRPALGALTMAAPLVTGALSSLLAGALSP